MEDVYHWWYHLQISRIYKHVLDTISVQKSALTYVFLLKEMWFCSITHLCLFLVKVESPNWSFRDSSIKEYDYPEKQQEL